MTRRRLRGMLILLTGIVAAFALAGPAAYAGDAGDEYVLDIPPEPSDDPSSSPGTVPADPYVPPTTPEGEPATSTGAASPDDASASDGSSSDAGGGSGGGGTGNGGGGDSGSGDKIASVDFGKTGSSESVPDIAAGAGGDGGVPLLLGALVAIAATGGFAAWRRRHRATSSPLA